MATPCTTCQRLLIRCILLIKSAALCSLVFACLAGRLHRPDQPDGWLRPVGGAGHACGGVKGYRVREAQGADTFGTEVKHLNAHRWILFLHTSKAPSRPSPAHAVLRKPGGSQRRPEGGAGLACGGVRGKGHGCNGRQQCVPRTSMASVAFDVHA